LNLGKAETTGAGAGERKTARGRRNPENRIFERNPAGKPGFSRMRDLSF
jgi:hypothetical protein